MFPFAAAAVLVLFAQEQVPTQDERPEPPRFPRAAATWGIHGTVAHAGGYVKPTKRPIPMRPELEPHFPDGTYVHEGSEINRDGTLPHVFVFVSKAGGIPVEKQWSFTAPKKDAVLVQKGYRFVPHVIGVMVGQPLAVTSEDTECHNVHWLGRLNRFGKNNFIQNKGQIDKGVFRKPEHTRIICDLHGWMSCQVHILAHPLFSVTDSEGRFSLPKLPAGEYEITAVHERWKTVTTKVSVGGESKRGNKRIEIKFPVAKSPKRTKRK